MRIGMMADIYKPHISGVTNFISQNKSYLEKLGHEVYVFTFQSSTRDETYRDEEANIIRSQGIPILDTGFHFNLRYSKAARQILQTMDVAHVHHPFLSGTLAVSYCRGRGIPIVFTNHTRYDLYAQAYLPAVADIISETAMEAFLPTFCRSIDLTIAPSAGMKDVLIKFGVDSEIAVIPNGVDIKPFRSPAEVHRREDFGFNQEDVIFMYVGRLGPEKNLTFLLQAFRGLAQAFDGIDLMLIGEGPERESLQNMVSEWGLDSRVRFTGLVPYLQLPGYLAMGNAFVTASVTEVHPLSVIEAMAAGLPILGIQSPGVGDTIEDGVTGLLLRDEADIAGFTAKMVRLAIDHDKRKVMGAQAYQSAEQYAIERTVHLMLESYQKVITANAGRKRSWIVRINRLLDRWRSP